MKLGDTIAKAAAAIGIPHCNACERRRKLLNGLTWKQYRQNNANTSKISKRV